MFSENNKENRRTQNKFILTNKSNPSMDPWLIILISLIFSAFFSGMEIAFVASNKLHLELDKKKKRISSGIISIFQKNSSEYISTMLIGNNIALVIYGIQIAAVLDPIIRINIIRSDSGVLLIQTVLSTLLILITAEFLPKAFFRNNSNLTLNIFAIPVFVVYAVFYPLTKLVIFLSNLIIRIFLGVKLKDKNREISFKKIDLDNFLTETKDKELHEKEDANNFNIFRKAMTFEDVKVRECMIPRTEINALNINDTIENLRQNFIDSGLSKILIYEETIDKIIGYVHHSELFNEPADIKSIIREVPIVPETLSAKKLLSIFLKDYKSIAVVVDEFGGTAGIITVEDIIEEIFGEIQDEHDSSKFEEKQISESEYVFAARLEIDYLNDKYNIALPESDEYETLAGLILSYNQDVPRLNEVIEIENFKFTVLEVTPKRIDLLHVAVNAERG